MSLLEMMTATTIMATLMATVVVVVRSGYAAWNAQEADIDRLENGYGVLRHVAQQLRQADSVTAISAPASTTGSLSFLPATGATRTWSYNSGTSEVYFNNGTSNQVLAKTIDTLNFVGYEADGVTPTTTVDDIQVREVYRHGDPASRQRRNADTVLPGLDSIVVTTRRMKTDQHNVWVHSRRRRRRSAGVALLLTLFVISIVTVWVVNMLESATVYQSALRNTIEYEQALYQANAGVHHAVCELENDTAWRGTVTAGSYPASNSYSATAVNGAVPGTVDITSTGVAGETTRRLSATVLVN